MKSKHKLNLHFRSTALVAALAVVGAAGAQTIPKEGNYASPAAGRASAIHCLRQDAHGIQLRDDRHHAKQPAGRLRR
jgi:hypothetical protein